MKILMVNKFLYPKGGSEIYMLDLSKKLTDMGHEVFYFGMADEKNTVGVKNGLEVKNLNFKSKSIKRFLYPFKTIYSFEARNKMEKLIKTINPDIVHLNNYNYQITPSIVYAAKKAGIPIIQTIHDTNIICPYHRLYNFKEQKICEKCKGGKFYHCAATKCVDNSLSKSIIATIEAYTYKYLHTYKYIKYLVCPSKFMSEKLKEFGISPRKMKVLYNFTVPNRGNSNVNKKEQVLYFGRISEEKGINTLLDAIAQLRNIKFVFAGAGPLSEEVIKYPNIEYVGYKSGEQLFDLISQSLFSIIPSEWYENCPMSILESMSLGTPVIGSDIGGIPELIKHDSTGLLYRTGDKEDLVSKINELYKNRSKLAKMSKQCIIEADKYSIDNYYENIMEVYRSAAFRGLENQMKEVYT